MDTNDVIFKDQHDMGDTIPEYIIHEHVSLEKALFDEINDLRAEVIRWRQVLIKYLPKDWAEGLEQDIRDNLSATFWDYKAYEDYVKYYNHGEDPLDNDELSSLTKRLIAGTDETSINYM